MKRLLSLVAVCSFSNVWAAQEHEHAPAKVSPAFESMKSLVGTWEGKARMHDKEQDIKVTYELTSGGTALVEKTNPGTPMEMVTVYASNGDKVFATHFCPLGNQPQMSLKQSTDKVFTFEMDGTKGISNKNDMHMHGVVLTLDNNKLKQEWTNYNNGKKTETHAFELSRKI